jgi:hypothetical protein
MDSNHPGCGGRRGANRLAAEQLEIPVDEITGLTKGGAGSG